MENSMDANSKAVSYNTLYITLSAMTCSKLSRFTFFFAFLKASYGVQFIINKYVSDDFCCKFKPPV